jgi:hypothetical protein
MKGTWQTTDGGGAGASLLIALVVVIVFAAATAGPVVHAAEDLVRILLITAAVLAGLVVGAVIGALAWRARHPRQNSTTPESFAAADQLRAMQARTAPRELPAQVHNHVHIHGLSAEDVAAVVARQSQRPSVEEQR